MPTSSEAFMLVNYIYQCGQRTELYEYSKVLGNSQFSLLPFQPYKLIYAHMLVEFGKVADALK